MALTEKDLAQLRNELETRLATVTVDQMKAATAIGAYGERFTAVDAQFVAVHARLDGLSADVDRRFDEIDRRFELMDRRFDEIDRRFHRIDDRLDRFESRLESLESKLDSRFGWQTFMMAVLGFLILFGDTVRPLLGLG